MPLKDTHTHTPGADVMGDVCQVVQLGDVVGGVGFAVVLDS